jgi:hypothetical protein
MTWLLAVAPSALAADVGLDPQNRLHLGVNVVDGPSPIGVTGGFDSRLTRLVNLDVGAFVSPVPISEDVDVGASEFAEFQRLRHGVYVAPGLRIPHPQPKAFAYDLTLRGGAGVIWIADLDSAAFDKSNYNVTPAAAGVVGADVLLRVQRVGLRVSGKAWMYSAVQPSPEKQIFMLRSQWGVEGVYQF